MQQSPSPPGEQPVLLSIIWHVQQQLGALQEGQRSALAAIERSRVENHQRHDRLEERLWHLERAATPPPPASPTMISHGGPSRTDYLLTAMQYLITILKLLLPLAVLAALVAGKISNPDAFPVIRQALGLQ